MFFFFPGNSLVFYTFGKKTSVCVKRLFFFFSASGKKKKTDFSNECVSRVKLFQEKKKNKKKKQIPGRKKHNKIEKFLFSVYNFGLWRVCRVWHLNKFLIFLVYVRLSIYYEFSLWLKTVEWCLDLAVGPQ